MIVQVEEMKRKRSRAVGDEGEREARGLLGGLNQVVAWRVARSVSELFRPFYGTLRRSHHSF